MPKTITLSASMQDYLEAILELEEAESSVRITDIAKKLKVAKASVNQTIGKFKELGLVRQKMYGPVELTRNGRAMAGKIMQNHKKLKQFLVDILGVDAEVAEQDACLMEHAVSVETIERLTDFLCKNGYIFDDNIEKNKKNLDNKKIVKKLLSELKVGEKGIVVKIATKGVMRKRIMEMGIITGAKILVKGFAPLGDPMEVGIKGYSLSLRKSEAKNITVELVN